MLVTRVWPTYLPNPSTSFKIGSTPTLERTKMASGYIRQRLKSKINYESYQVSWELDDDEFELFKGIVNNYLEFGTAWFNMELPLGGGFKKVAARIINGKYTANYTAHMNWKVTASLETYSTTTENSTDLFYVAYGITVPDFASQVEDIMKTYYTRNWNG